MCIDELVIERLSASNLDEDTANFKPGH